ncbi:MAG: ADP-ribosylglycohydrolase family protein [Muribaculum sp.]|nr:ADP-ribosylglycohydrolase family protein [Muribaculum sp.]
MPSRKDRMLGCLYGQAIGDALGLGTEFLNKAEVQKHYPNGLSRYEDIIQDAHRRRWTKGAWTDDTDMMLCIMSAFEDGQFNIRQVAQNFKDWADGEPMGIGSHTFKVLAMGDYVEKHDDCSRLWWELSRKTSAANGALMRTSVIGLAKNNVEEQAEQICKLTHYDPRCVGSCVIATSIIHALVWENRELSYDEIRSIGDKYDNRIAEWIDLAHQSRGISALDLDEPHSIGYTLRTLSATLWCYWHATSFEEGLLAMVNEGGDADTNAAIACAILGAKYGYDTIPRYYIENLHNEAEYRQKVKNFITLALNEKISD